MSFQDFMGKIRQLDNQAARWMMRHFYILFFEFVLVIIFFIFFFNLLRSLDLGSRIPPNQILSQLLHQQLLNTQIIIVLLLLNSFWMLYIFNGMSRIRTILKEVSFHLSRRRPPPNNRE